MGFPPNPIDKQIVEVGGSVYIYSTSSKAWIRVDGIFDPSLATPQSDGLMSKEDFNKIMGLLLPPPRITLTSQDCNAKFDQGVISLRSLDESLNITSSPKIMNKIAGVSGQDKPWHLHEDTHAFDFTVNIDQLLEEVSQRGKLRYKKTKGPQGAKGPRGEPGIDRLDTGPQGPVGDPGANAPFDGILTLDNVSFVQADPNANRAIVDITTESISPEENYIVVSRATIGNPNACPKLVRPKKYNSPWLLVADVPPGQCFVRDPKCDTSCGTTLYYVDVTIILQLLQERYETLVRTLKARKEALVLEWMRTMIAVFNTQKNAICCALENCQSRTRNQDFRDRVDNARIQAAQSDLKLIMQGPGKDMIEMDPDKECSLPGGGADVVQMKCSSLIQSIPNSWVQSPDGYEPVPLADIPGMNLPNGGPWTDAPTPYNLAVDLERGLYRAKIIDCCPVNIGDADPGGVGTDDVATRNGNWRTTGDMKRWRNSGLVVVNIGDNKAMVIGGLGGVNHPKTDSGWNMDYVSSRTIPEIYDYSTERWTDAASVTYAPGYIGGHNAILLNNGKVLLAGGYDAYSGAYAPFCELYNPSTDTWATTGNMVGVLGRREFTMTMLNDGRVLVVGGRHPTSASSYASLTPTISCEIYDPNTGTWAVTGGMSVPRFGHTATLLSNGTVLVAGGRDGSSVTHKTAEIYDIASGTWSQTGEMTYGVYGHDAALMTDGRVVIAGGVKSDPSVYTATETTSCQFYTPSTNSWINAPEMHTGSSRLAILPNGNMLNGGPRASEVLARSDGSYKWGDIYTSASGGTNVASTTLDNSVIIAVGHNTISYGFNKNSSVYEPLTAGNEIDPYNPEGAYPTIHKSRKIQLAYNSGDNYLVLGQIKDYSKEIAKLGGVKALDPASVVWPKLHNIMNSDPNNHVPVLFSHNGGWVGSFINHDQPYTNSGPNDAIVMGPATILIEDMECACRGALVTLDPRIHVTSEFNENIGVRVDGLQAGEYVIEIVDCCSAYKEGLYTGAFRYTQQMNDGKYKTSEVMIPSGQPYPDEDAFPTLAEAEAAYLGLRHSLSHPGGPLWLWIRDVPIEDNFGSTTLLIKDVLCYEQDIVGTDVTGAAPLIPNSCEMAATQVEWYERGWRIEECCGAYVVVDGVKWIVVKRSLGVDMTCGGGETMNTPCVRKFIEAEAGHPAIAWPTLDGVEFEGRPDSGVATFYYDKTMSDKIMQKILADESIKTLGDPKSIELILTPAIQ